MEREKPEFIVVYFVNKIYQVELMTKTFKFEVIWKQISAVDFEFLLKFSHAGRGKIDFPFKIEVFGAVESSCRFNEARLTRTIFVHLCWCLTDFSFSAIFSHFIDFFPTSISKTIKIISKIL